MSSDQKGTNAGFLNRPLAETISVGLAARIANASESTVRRWCDEGRFKVARPAGRWHIFREEFVAWLQQVNIGEAQRPTTIRHIVRLSDRDRQTIQTAVDTAANGPSMIPPPPPAINGAISHSADTLADFGRVLEASGASALQRFRKVKDGATKGAELPQRPPEVPGIEE